MPPTLNHRNIILRWIRYKANLLVILLNICIANTIMLDAILFWECSRESCSTKRHLYFNKPSSTVEGLQALLPSNTTITIFWHRRILSYLYYWEHHSTLRLMSTWTFSENLDMHEQLCFLDWACIKFELWAIQNGILNPEKWSQFLHS